MAFWGIALKGGQKQEVSVPKGEALHLSQICLCEPKAGKNFLQAQVKGTAYNFACLEKDKVEHIALDLFFEETCTFINKGASEIHLSGYMEPKDDGLSDLSDGEGEESEEGEGDESEQEDAPATASKASPKAATKASPKAAAAAAPPKASPKAQPKASPKVAAKAAPKEDSDDEDSLLDEMEIGEEEDKADDACESEEESEGEESEEEAAAPPAKKAKVEQSPKVAAAKKAASPKAAAPVAAATTKAASPKAAAPKVDPKQEQFVKDLVAYLKANGKTKVSDLGSKVKRPAGVPKMKAVFEQNKDKFAVAGEIVEAK